MSCLFFFLFRIWNKVLAVSCNPWIAFVWVFENSLKPSYIRYFHARATSTLSFDLSLLDCSGVIVIHADADARSFVETWFGLVIHKPTSVLVCSFDHRVSFHYIRVPVHPKTGPCVVIPRAYLTDSEFILVDDFSVVQEFVVIFLLILSIFFFTSTTFWTSSSISRLLDISFTLINEWVVSGIYSIFEVLFYRSLAFLWTFFFLFVP